MNKYTEWYPPGIKPLRIGAYMCISTLGNRYYCHWDGSNWGYFASTPEKAYESRHRILYLQNLKWRGLASSAGDENGQTN